MSTAADIITVVRDLLNDTGTPGPGATTILRHSDAELIRSITQAQRNIVSLIPESNLLVTARSITGTARVAPASSDVVAKFLKVTFQVATAAVDGTPVRALTFIQRDTLDQFEPTWQVPVAPADFDGLYHYIHDPRESGAFWVYPAVPVGETAHVVAYYSKVPEALNPASAPASLELELGDEYFNAIVDFVVWRQLSRDTRYVAPAEERLALWNNYLQSLGMLAESRDNIDSHRFRPPSTM